MTLMDENDQMMGVIGLQVDVKSYDELIPAPVIEEPYSLSFINLYDENMNTIWWWGCASEQDEYISQTCSENYNKDQDYNTAFEIISNNIVNKEDNSYIQWKEPIKV